MVAVRRRRRARALDASGGGSESRQFVASHACHRLLSRVRYSAVLIRIARTLGFPFSVALRSGRCNAVFMRRPRAACATRHEISATSSVMASAFMYSRRASRVVRLESEGKRPLAAAETSLAERSRN